jgi:hypothetical protein
MATAGISAGQSEIPAVRDICQGAILLVDRHIPWQIL